MSRWHARQGVVVPVHGRVRSRVRSRRVVGAAVAVLLCALAVTVTGAATTSPAAAATGCDTSWVGGDGDWDVAASWTDGIPTGTETACIVATGTYTVTVEAEQPILDVLGDEAGNTATAGDLVLGDGQDAHVTLDLVSTTFTPTGQSSPQTYDPELLVGTGTVGDGSSIVVDDDSTDTAATADVCMGQGFSNFGSIDVDSGFTAPVSLKGGLDNRGVVDLSSDTSQGQFAPSCDGDFIENDASFYVEEGVTFTDSGLFLQRAGTTGVDGSFVALGTEGSYSQLGLEGGAMTGTPPEVLGTSYLDLSGGTGTVLVHTYNAHLESDVGAGVTVDVQAGPHGEARLWLDDPSRDMIVNHGTVRLSSTVAGTPADLDAGDIASDDTLDNRGTITFAAGAGPEYWYGQIRNDGTIAVDQSVSAPFPVDLVNAGTLDVAAGATLESTDTLTQAVGVTHLDGTLQLDGQELGLENGALTGSGTVDGDLYNRAQVELGTGTLTVTGDYDQPDGGKLRTTITGPTAGTDYGQLDVGGVATVSGGLSVDATKAGTLAPSYVPLHAASISGAFGGVSVAPASLRPTMTYQDGDAVLHLDHVVTVPPPHCTLTAAPRLLRHAAHGRRDRLQARVDCDQAVTATVTGTAHVHGRHAGPVNLVAAHAPAAARRTVTLRLGVPARVSTALRRHQHVTVTLRLVASGGDRSTTVRARVDRLEPPRGQ